MMLEESETGFDVRICGRAPLDPGEGAIEIDVGADLPVAFTGLQKLLVALGALATASALATWRAHASEWNVLFPDAPLEGRDLFEVADAPNQRRLFRESEQVFRILNVAAHGIVEAVRTLGRPIVLRNAGAIDLVSLRGIMHAVQCARLAGARGSIFLCDWSTGPAHGSGIFAATRAEHLARACARMRVSIAPDQVSPPFPPAPSSARLERDYLTRVTSVEGPLESRIAAALLAIRACFFSTNHEGAMLAAETALGLLDATNAPMDEAALGAAWDAQDDLRFDVPMVEIDRSSLGDAEHMRATFLLHAGVVRVFTGHHREALDVFGLALARSISPELTADLRLYRALTTTKMLGDVEGARVEINAGLAALEGRSRASAATHQAWLHNLMALTYFQDRNVVAAQREEELALACIDDMPGPSAAHMKTNLISNFSVLYEAKGEVAMATRIWQLFAALNATLGSDAADKVYLNRLGALEREAGHGAAAIQAYEEAYRKAQETGDVFHSETIAGAIARAYLDRDGAEGRARAVHWFQIAAASARACGDCLQLAKNLAGVAIASGANDFSEARAVLARDLAHGVEAAPLARALSSDDTRAISRELPRAKSKLSRPFTLVNL